VKARSTMRNQGQESGIALLIAIFVLLLISVVAISLVVSSGTESALAGNYRSSTGVYYAALAGMEEARGRLLAKNPNSFLKTAPANFMPPPGTQWDIGYVRYILNPGPADAVDTRTANPDTEYNSEFGPGKLEAATSAGTVATTQSVWNVSPLNALPVPGPLYKWVRINAVSEVSLKRQVAPFGDGHTPDPTKPIYYDGTLLTIAPAGARQVLEITALAVLPNGTQNNSQKIVQYLAAPAPIALPPFLAALSLSGSPGNDPVFHAPASNNAYAVKGDDYDCNGILLPLAPKKAAIGIYGDYSGGSSGNAVTAAKTAIPPVDQPNYTGQGGAPDVEPFQTSQTPSQVDSIVQTIVQNADVTLPSGPVTYPLPTVTGSALTPLGMTSANPLTVVVNGNLDISNWSNDGYGLLLVIGTLTYDPDTNWNGIVLVIGQGVVNNTQNGQNKQISGAMFVAKTRDPSGNLVAPKLGAASVTFLDAMQGKGVHYSSCWIQKAQPTSGYQVLSFHEISQ
jgi:Tfp pilus assembly protein PilX